jgi:pimeloyl-ACP methyl ester carboxylesterase
MFNLDDQRELQQLLPQAVLKTYENVGHSPQWEVPELVARDLLAFLAST